MQTSPAPPSEQGPNKTQYSFENLKTESFHRTFATVANIKKTTLNTKHIYLNKIPRPPKLLVLYLSCILVVFLLKSGIKKEEKD